MMATQAIRPQSTRTRNTIAATTSLAANLRKQRITYMVSRFIMRWLTLVAHIIRPTASIRSTRRPLTRTARRKRAKIRKARRARSQSMALGKQSCPMMTLSRSTARVAKLRVVMTCIRATANEAMDARLTACVGGTARMRGTSI